MRYLQIFVWGRVMEINEDVAMRAVSVTLLSMSMWIMYCMNLNLQMVIFFRAFSKLDSEDIIVPINLCRLEEIDPMNAR